MRRFVSLFDIHWGYERVRGKIQPVHCLKALAIALAFIRDFQPHDIILGGDALDCASISHWNDRKPGRVEGLRLFNDAQELRTHVLEPLEKTKAKLVFIEGNHEGWLHQLVEAVPGLEGIVEPKTLLKLNAWKIVPQGGNHHLGKLVFKHGDTITGGEHAAKAASIASEKSVRFGHFHTYAAYTKVSDVDLKQKHVGVSMPCLCLRGPGYGKGKANKWINGFGYGWTFPDGGFSDSVALIINNRTVVNGKVYKA